MSIKVQLDNGDEIELPDNFEINNGRPVPFINDNPASERRKLRANALLKRGGVESRARAELEHAITREQLVDASINYAIVIAESKAKSKDAKYKRLASIIQDKLYRSDRVITDDDGKPCVAIINDKRVILDFNYSASYRRGAISQINGELNKMIGFFDAKAVKSIASMIDLGDIKTLSAKDVRVKVKNESKQILSDGRNDEYNELLEIDFYHPLVRELNVDKATSQNVSDAKSKALKEQTENPLEFNYDDLINLINNMLDDQSNDPFVLAAALGMATGRRFIELVRTARIKSNDGHEIHWSGLVKKRDSDHAGGDTFSIVDSSIVRSKFNELRRHPLIKKIIEETSVNEDSKINTAIERRTYRQRQSVMNAWVKPLEQSDVESVNFHKTRAIFLKLAVEKFFDDEPEAFSAFCAKALVHDSDTAQKHYHSIKLVDAQMMKDASEISVGDMILEFTKKDKSLSRKRSVVRILEEIAKADDPLSYLDMTAGAIRNEFGCGTNPANVVLNVLERAAVEARER